MISAFDVKSRLHGQIDAVVLHLLPSGKKQGREWVCGSTEGEAGGSLKVCISGTKIGVWADFASGDKGDILDLWKTVRQISFKEAFDEACKFVGISEIAPVAPKVKPARPTVAEKAIVPISNTAVKKYLNDERLLADEVLIKYGVRGFDHDLHRQLHGGSGPSGKDFIAFRWIDSEGDLVTIKTTSIHKDARGKKIIWSTDQHQTLWGWNLVKDSDRNIVICEGEIDAMSICQMGCNMPVLSVPSGSSNLDWIDNDYARLQHFENIYICPDNDAPGKAMAAKVCARLGLSRTYILPLPSNSYKDANDVLREGNEYHTDAMSWFAQAYTMTPPTIQEANDDLESLKALYARARNQETSKFIFPEMDFDMRDGEMTLLSGYPGSGKSQWLYMIVLHEIRMGNKFLLCSYEITPTKMKRGIITLLHGENPTDEQIEEVLAMLKGNLWFLNPKKPVVVSDLYRDIEYSASRFGVNRFAIDSLHFLVKKDDWNDQDQLSDDLHEINMRLNSHLILVCHARTKAKGVDYPPGMEEVEGSGGVTTAPENGVSIWRNSLKQKAIDEAIEEGNDSKRIKAEALHDGYIIVWKQREGSGWLGKKRLYFDKQTHSFRTTSFKPKSSRDYPTKEEQDEIF